MMTRNFCITLPEYPEKQEQCRQYFQSKGLFDVSFFHGLHAEKAGLKTLHTYEIDNPGTNFSIGFKPTGIWLSHWALFGAMNLLWDNHFWVMEDDIKLPDEWHTRMNQAMNDVPADFDVLYTGSCCVDGRVTKHVKGDVYECTMPLCTHSIVWAKKALPVVLANLRKVWAPVDIALTLEVLPKLKSYVVLPRIAEQFNTVIPP